MEFSTIRSRLPCSAVKSAMTLRLHARAQTLLRTTIEEIQSGRLLYLDIVLPPPRLWPDCEQVSDATSRPKFARYCLSLNGQSLLAIIVGRDSSEPMAFTF